MVYLREILVFSVRRFREIARQRVRRMQSIEAPGLFGDDHKHKTLWLIQRIQCKRIASSALRSGGGAMIISRRIDQLLEPVSVLLRTGLM